MCYCSIVVWKSKLKCCPLWSCAAHLTVEFVACVMHIAVWPLLDLDTPCLWKVWVLPMKSFYCLNEHSDVVTSTLKRHISQCSVKDAFYMWSLSKSTAAQCSEHKQAWAFPFYAKCCLIAVIIHAPQLLGLWDSCKTHEQSRPRSHNTNAACLSTRMRLMITFIYCPCVNRYIIKKWLQSWKFLFKFT